MPNFTTEDLLVYIYNEMDPEQGNEVKQSLQTDWALQQKCGVLLEAQEKLNETPLLSPRIKIVNRILKYAASHLYLSN